MWGAGGGCHLCRPVPSISWPQHGQPGEGQWPRPDLGVSAGCTERSRLLVPSQDPLPSSRHSQSSTPKGSSRPTPSPPVNRTPRCPPPPPPPIPVSACKSDSQMPPSHPRLPGKLLHLLQSPAGARASRTHPSHLLLLTLTPPPPPPSPVMVPRGPVLGKRHVVGEGRTVVGPGPGSEAAGKVVKRPVWTLPRPVPTPGPGAWRAASISSPVPLVQVAGSAHGAGRAPSPGAWPLPVPLARRVPQRSPRGVRATSPTSCLPQEGRDSGSSGWLPGGGGSGAGVRPSPGHGEPGAAGHQAVGGPGVSGKERADGHPVRPLAVFPEMLSFTLHMQGCRMDREGETAWETVFPSVKWGQ